MNPMEALSNIQTVDDLLKIQEGKPETTQEVVDGYCRPIYDETPAIGLSICEQLVCSLRELHQIMIDEMSKEDPDPKTVAAWAMDMSKLDTVICLLNDIQL